MKPEQKNKLHVGSLISFIGYNGIEDFKEDKTSILYAIVEEIHDGYVVVDDDLADNKILFDDILEIIEN